VELYDLYENVAVEKGYVGCVWKTVEGEEQQSCVTADCRDLSDGDACENHDNICFVNGERDGGGDGCIRYEEIESCEEIKNETYCSVCKKERARESE
jgi:hypothetical protein